MKHMRIFDMLSYIITASRCELHEE